MTDIPGLAARRAALVLLDAVLRRGLPLESALAGATRGLSEDNDKALTRAIASETLRWLPDLDALIDGATRLRLADDAKARMVLRLALAQLLVMKTPDHAAIATALPLVEGGPRRLVHGVIGTLLRRGAALPEMPHLPTDVAARWVAAWGAAMVDDARAALADQPPLDLTLRDPSETEAWTERLGGESLAWGHVRIAHGSPVTMSPGYDEGAWWVQGLSASIPARLLGKGAARAVLDLCAAPGGKGMQLAAAGWDVTSLDRDAGRMALVEANFARTGLSAHFVVADIAEWAPTAPVPAILLDAPCSATGIFARHPEALHRARPKDIAELAAAQTAMLKRAAAWLELGGVLVYATCSLEPEEGEAQVAVAEAAGLRSGPIGKDELPAGFAPHERGWLRVLPRPGVDGFFIARFKRIA